MKIAEPIKGCRYWGFEPACGELRHATGKIGYDRAKALNKQFKEEIRVLQDHKIKQRYGFSKEEAIALAQKVEDTTGIEMWVFNHDYL